jgi:hypothetical protein
LEPLLELVLRATKEFSKAFIQEKAIYKRNSESLSNIVNLANLALEEGDEETAAENFNVDKPRFRTVCPWFHLIRTKQR